MTDAPILFLRICAVACGFVMMAAAYTSTELSFISWLGMFALGGGSVVFACIPAPEPSRTETLQWLLDRMPEYEITKLGRHEMTTILKYEIEKETRP